MRERDSSYMELGSTIALERQSAPERAFRVPISTEIHPGQREYSNLPVVSGE